MRKAAAIVRNIPSLFKYRRDYPLELQPLTLRKRRVGGLSWLKSSPKQVQAQLDTTKKVESVFPNSDRNRNQGF